MDERPAIAFIGAGRVAGMLARAFAELGYPVPAVASRSPQSAQRVASLLTGCRAVSLQDAANSAGVVFITTSDGAVNEVASGVAWRAGQGVVHCSGALTCEPLAPARAAGASVGSWHPFQTFGGETTLAGVTFGIEAEGELLAFLERLASEVGGHPLRVPADARALYHAASVLSCGYLTTLLGEARTLWTRAGLPPEQAFQAITHIARTTVTNIERFGAETALTGPTSRGDTGTVQLHLEAVRGVAPELLPLYREICLRSVELAREAGRAGGDMDLRPLLAEYEEGGAGS
ncbi:MAG: DUF2520 domain-containing protein [Chloroflexi bacterium]|nr:DUF2520 domain-containing protein [Chloroflexota bacterium]